uniref:Uncharacterized protein n=3 Tax=Opuntia streptacantha TaxID=393608 RepID=A0A7C9EY19_OPUST
MRGFSTLASRASPAIKTLREPIHNHPKPFTQNPNNHPPNAYRIGAQRLRGKASSSPRFSNSSFKNKFSPEPIDHKSLSQILSRRDWHLLLDHELRAGRVILTPQSV